MINKFARLMFEIASAGPIEGNHTSPCKILSKREMERGNTTVWAPMKLEGQHQSLRD